METQTFVFFGQVGSGKGTQVKLLMDYLKQKDNKEAVYAGTGEAFRKLVQTENYTSKIVKEKMGIGELQPDFLTTALFTDILINNLSPEKHMFADGYPRTVVQAKSFETMIQFYKRDQVKIIYIEVGRLEAMKRNLARGRADDTQEGILKRFDEYTNNVLPAMEYFANKEGYKIYTINGEQSIGEVHQDIIKALNF